MSWRCKKSLKHIPELESYRCKYYTRRRYWVLVVEVGITNRPAVIIDGLARAVETIAISKISRLQIW